MPATSDSRLYSASEGPQLSPLTRINSTMNLGNFQKPEGFVSTLLVLEKRLAEEQSKVHELTLLLAEAQKNQVQAKAQSIKVEAPLAPQAAKEISTFNSSPVKTGILFFEDGPSLSIKDNDFSFLGNSRVRFNILQDNSLCICSSRSNEHEQFKVGMGKLATEIHMSRAGQELISTRIHSLSPACNEMMTELVRLQILTSRIRELENKFILDVNVEESQKKVILLPGVMRATPFYGTLHFIQKLFYFDVISSTCSSGTSLLSILSPSFPCSQLPCWSGVRTLRPALLTLPPIESLMGRRSRC
jgi:hypothetical protein